MNFLSHQAVARTVTPDGSPWFCVGNILPDLLSTTGRRLREGEVAETQADSPESVALLRGIHLHHATDRRFHGHPLFKQACSEATELLRVAPFSTPPRRLFFLAHILVEIALDGLLVNQHPDLPDDLYTCLETCEPAAIAVRTAALLQTETALPELAVVIERFLAAHYLPSYRDFEGQMEALRRVYYRAGLGEIASPEDQATLCQVLHDFAPRLVVWQKELLLPPEPDTMPVVK